ncbi:KAP family P-loop NTPase fold protein [Thalassotalea agariperforans]
MKDSISFDWSEKLEITDNKIDPNIVIETFPIDKLQRQKYAEFLTKFLASEGRDDIKGLNSNYVLNLNSQWGSGKSYFLRRWSNDIKAYFPVVYIDAWKQDYSDDPLMTVVSSMINQLTEQCPNSNEDRFKPPNQLISLFKAAGPSLARGLAKRYLGVDPSKLFDTDNDTHEENATDENGNPIDMGLAASKVVEQLIDEHDAKSKAINKLKNDVERWIKEVVEQESRSYPAFIFIDELDRCRPSYAVEMLETIKHIFDIPGVVFVVATDTEQLQHAVKAIYGLGFDARTYLTRFFNSRFTLKAPNLDNLIEVHCDIKKFSKEYFDNLDIVVWPINDNYLLTLGNITTVLNAFNLSPRIAIQVTERIIAIVSNLPNKTAIDVVMLASLLCIREKDESLYEEIITKKFNRKKGEQNLNLSDYLIETFNIEGGDISISVEISEHSSNFNINKLRFFSSGVYLVDYLFYLSDTFADFFDEGVSSFHFFGSNSRDSISPIQMIVNDVYQLSPEESKVFSGKGAELWFKYLYLKNKINEGNIGLYQDLVELASAIDWLNEDVE